MRKVVLYTLMSLDGAVDDLGDYFREFDPQMYANLAAVIGAQDTVLLGRRTYDQWAPHWPASDEQPFADFINQVAKIVFSSTTPTTPWANSTVATEPVEDLVRKLRERSGGDIGVHGSITLARSLLHAGLVDELRLVVAPVLDGAGRRLFDETLDLRRLDLIRAAGTSSGGVLLDYRLA
jgi:dihydrofolate reductase